MWMNWDDDSVRRETMLAKVAAWLDEVLEQSVPEEVVAFCFNLYEDGDNSWSMELVGTASFDEEDMDWACDEVTDFGTREVPFGVLKEKNGVGVGFVDGDIEIIYM